MNSDKLLKNVKTSEKFNIAEVEELNSKYS